MIGWRIWNDRLAYDGIVHTWVSTDGYTCITGAISRLSFDIAGIAHAGWIEQTITVVVVVIRARVGGVVTTRFGDVIGVIVIIAIFVQRNPEWVSVEIDQPHAHRISGVSPIAKAQSGQRRSTTPGPAFAADTGFTGVANIKIR